jgi:dipeptidyl aminopeptidase/acylaminoacyl peptidase
MLKLIFKVIIFLMLSMTLMAKDALNFDAFFEVDRVDPPIVSMDGKWISFSVKKANIEENTYQTHLWIMDANGDNKKQITTEGKRNASPAFSNSSEDIYYLSNRSEFTQVWMYNLKSGNHTQVTNVHGSISGFVLSPDNTFMVLQRETYPDCKSEDCIKEMDDKKGTARIIDNLMYRHWNEWLEGKYKHLFVYNLSDKSITDITPGPFHAPPISLGSSHDVTISPDGKEVCFVSNQNEMVAISTNNDVFIVDQKGVNQSKVSASAGNDNNPHYSPDGVQIAYTSMKRAGFEADQLRLKVYNRKTKLTEDYSADLKFSISELVWGPDGKSIYILCEETGDKSIYKIDLDNKSITPVLKKHYIKGIKFLNSGEMVFAKQTASWPHEIFKYNLDSKELTMLTDFNSKLRQNYDLPGYEEFWFTGALGEKVQGFIMKPPNFEEGKKYPAIHLIHGGPQGMWGNDFHFRWNYQMFASKGYVVYMINFHGSKGYGQKFTDVISGHWGDYPYEDLVKGTEYVLKNYEYIDEERLAAAGASYGGFMVNWIAGHENPYKCLVSHDGVYDQVSMWGSTEELWFPEWEFGGVPWQDGTTFDKWSPSRLAGNFKTPTLVIHGEKDYRVPYTQGLQMFSALQRQGVPSRLLYFPDEDHFVKKPKNARIWWQTVHEWFAEYLN